MSNSISWVGNKVLSSGAPRTANREAIPLITDDQRNEPFMPSFPVQQNSMGVNEAQQGPPPVTEQGYIPYFLASNIGKRVYAEFLIGNSQYIDKTGVIIEVGINYFVLDDQNFHTHVMCDLYSVKFVTILP